MDSVYLDSVNRDFQLFMKDNDCLSPKEIFELFCEFFGVTEDAAAAYFNGFVFVPKEKI